VAQLPVVSGKACIDALGKIGYRVVRQKRSHARLICAGRGPVTVPLHAELDRGTLRAILRSVDLSVEEFVNLLD
jgi:predicted RNA binding protein YcfA (HicA-like mRNA interferase family)